MKVVSLREFEREREHQRELRAAARDLRDADQRALQIKQEAEDKAERLAQRQRADKDASQNEWRGESSDRQATYASRVEVAAQFATLTAKLEPVLDYVSAQKGRTAGVSALQATLIGLAGLAIAVLGIAVALGR